MSDPSLPDFIREAHAELLEARDKRLAWLRASGVQNALWLRQVRFEANQIIDRTIASVREILSE